MGFAPASAGLLMLIGGLTDCGANLLAAAAATRMRSKLGRYRPFLIYGAAPLGVTFGLLFIKPDLAPATVRSEEHTSELQSLMRISYAVFCLKKKKHENSNRTNTQSNPQHALINTANIYKHQYHKSPI